MLDDATFHSPVASTDITRIVSLRDTSLATLTAAVDTLVETFAATDAVRKDLAGVLLGNGIHTGADKYGADVVFGSIYDPDKAKANLRRSVDVAVWRGLMAMTGFNRLMDATAKEAFDLQLQGDDVPEVSEETVRATFAQLFEDADTIFKRGIATAFSKLDRRFKSHDGFKLGARVVISGAFDTTFGSTTYGRAWDTIADIERAFAVLDGVPPDPRALERAVDESRKGGGYGPKQSEAQTRYFRIKGFMNGNAHLWFVRDDLVERVNRLLASFYGDVLPDAWETASQDPARANRSQSTAVSTDLQFYPTPGAVAKTVAGERLRDERVLEPSAGEGAMAAAALNAGAARVDCVEVDPARAATLSGRFGRDGRVSVRRANFLELVPDPVYDAVLMNPPFFGVHYMAHVRHAFEFLRPGGTLRAVLPSTVEFGETKAHVEFRKWAMARGAKTYGGEFKVCDLPMGSFKESGTNVSTCILTLEKPR